MIERTKIQTNGKIDAFAHIILAHGAGAPMDSPFMEGIAKHLAERQMCVIRFEFPYMAARRDFGKRSPPNRMPVLLEAWRKVIADVIQEFEPKRLAIGGKSLGGRAASLLMAEIDSPKDVHSLVTLGYPFHPPGRPDTLRTEHLADIEVPVLMVQGTRDPFGSKEEVLGYSLPPSNQLVWCEDGNHDLKPRKKSGRTQDQALQEAADAISTFIHK